MANNYESGQSTPEVLDPVDVDEIIKHTFDFAEQLNADTETIKDVVWTVISGGAVIGDGSTPVVTARHGSVTPDDISNSNTTATAMIYTGGVAGTVVVECQIETQKADLTFGQLWVRSFQRVVVAGK